MSGSGSPFDFRSHAGVRGVAQSSISRYWFVLKSRGDPERAALRPSIRGVPYASEQFRPWLPLGAALLIVHTSRISCFASPRIGPAVGSHFALPSDAFASLIDHDLKSEHIPRTFSHNDLEIGLLRDFAEVASFGNEEGRTWKIVNLSASPNGLN